MVSARWVSCLTTTLCVIQIGFRVLKRGIIVWIFAPLWLWLPLQLQQWKFLKMNFLNVCKIRNGKYFFVPKLAINHRFPCDPKKNVRVSKNGLTRFFIFRRSSIKSLISWSFLQWYSALLLKSSIFSVYKEKLRVCTKLLYWIQYSEVGYSPISMNQNQLQIPAGQVLMKFHWITTYFED